MTEEVVIPARLKAKIDKALAELAQADRDLNWPLACQRTRTAEARAAKAITKLNKYKEELAELGIIMHFGC